MRNCCPRARLALRLWRGFALARGWLCGSVAALPSRAVGFAVLSRLCPLRVWHRVSVAALPSVRARLCGSVAALPSVHARLCVPVAALFLGSRPALRSCRGASPSRTVGIAFLSRRLPSRTVGIAFLPRRLPLRASGFAFLSRRFSSVHACCLSRDKQDGLRYAPFLFRRVEIAIRAFSRRCSVICLGGFTSGLAVSLWRSRRVTGERVTGLAARRLCAFVQSHWL